MKLTDGKNEINRKKWGKKGEMGKKGGEIGKKGGEWGKKGEKRKTMGENIGKILKNCRMTWKKKG